MFKKQYLIKVLVLISIFTNILIAKELEKVSLQLQWLDQFQFAGYYIAKEKGFYKDIGIDVEIKKFNYTKVSVDEVAKHNTTYGIGRSTLIIDKSHGKDIVLLASIFQSSPLILLSTDQTNIKNIGDFYGKRIMFTPDASSTISLRAMMNKYEITIDDIKMQEHTFNVDDLLNQKTDLMASYISNEPFVLKQKGIKAKIFNPKDYGFDFYSDILYTSEYEIQHHRQRVINFTQASLKGWEYAFNHIDETVDIILKKYNTQNKSKEALLYEAKELKKLAYYKTNKLGTISKHKIQRIYDLYNVLGYIKEKINLNKFILELRKYEMLLTTKEKEYLHKHPTIKINNETNWPPFNFNENNIPQGYSIDYMNLIANKLNIKLEYITNHSWDQFMKILQTDKLDLIVNIAKNKERSKAISFTKPYLKLKNTIYIKSDTKESFRSLASLNGKTIAMPKDFITQKFIQKYYPKINQVLVKDSLEALQYLSLGKVDATVGKKIVLDYIIKHNLISNVKPISYVEDSRVVTSLRLGSAKEDKILIDIINKVQNQLNKDEIEQLKKKWFGYDNQLSNYQLTLKELKHLKNKKVLKVCTNPDWTPIEFIQDNKPKGISIDTLDIIANKLNLKLEYIKTKSWKQSQNFLEQRRCDILPAAIKTPSRSKYALFTKPYLNYNLAIITKDDKPLVENIELLLNKKMTRKKGSGLIKKLKQLYPNIKIQKTVSYKDAFLEIQKGSSYYTIATIPVFSYYKKKYNLDKLQIAGYTNMKYNLSMAIRSDDKLLFSAITKVMNKIPPITHRVINEKWINIDIVKTIDYTLIKNLSILFVSILIVVLYFLVRQSKLKKEVEDLNHNLEEKIQEAMIDLIEAKKLAKMGVWSVDIKSNQLKYCDETYTILNMVEMKNKSITLKDYLNKVHIDDTFMLLLKYNRHIKQHIPFDEIHRIIVTNNQVKWVEVKCITLYDDMGIPLISKGTIQDITEKKLKDIELMQKDKQMLHQNRLAQMGEMISMIAHQWRQPLNAINLTTSNLELKCMLNEINADYFMKELKNVDYYSQHLSKTIDDFRGFFKDNKTKTFISLENIIKDILNIVQVSLKNKNIKVITDFKCDKLVKIYSNEVKQVVLNLVKNAEDVIIEKKIQNPYISISAYCEDNIPTIIVKDNGGGINADIIDKIFEPYFSTKLEKDGTGLGLYMSKTIIEDHCNGKLSVSNDTNGAVFRIEL